MAVIQISKIQQRRGNKSITGIPQLSSAEFAWAIDSQELFIGNGSIAEGAPYVGNTKILTEHDNLLEQASSYSFGAPAITSISRSLQSKLDDTVSLLDFAVISPGQITDWSAAFDLAISQLYLDVITTYQKVLVIPNGVYTLTRDLALPSNCIIRGETKNGVIINIGANNIRALPIINLPSFNIKVTNANLIVNSSNRPSNISISNLTIQRTTGTIDISNLLTGVFENVIINGNYSISNTLVDVTSEIAAVSWTSLLPSTAATDISFNNCSFQSVSIAILGNNKSNYLVDSKFTFESCTFNNNCIGIYINGNATHINRWLITECEFDNIAYYAFYSSHGRSTRITGSKFNSCGNGGANLPISNIIYFGDATDNVVDDCDCDRQTSIGSGASQVAYAEVYNASRATFLTRNISPIFNSPGYTNITVFATTSKYIEIDYSLTLLTYSRVGRFVISIDQNSTVVSSRDDYTYSSVSETTTVNLTYQGVVYNALNIGSILTSFELYADFNSSSVNNTISLAYKNPSNITGVINGTLSYNVAYGI